MKIKTRRKPLPVDLGELTAAWNIGGPDYLPYRISLVAKLLDRCTTRLLAESCGLTVAEWRVLAQLANESPASVRKLAEHAWVDRAEVSRAAASLVRRGYVKRRDNPRDRRSALLSCTDEGLDVYKKIRPLRAEFHRSMTRHLKPEEAEKMEEVLAIIAKSCQDRLKSDKA